jgi:pilus assembly protein CpaF
MSCLVVDNGSAAPVELKDGVTVAIGRADGCELVLSGRKVSRRHALVRVEEGRISVEDCGSSFGTFVNGRKVEGSVVLKLDDRLTIGEVELHLRAVPPPVRPAASGPAAAGKEGGEADIPMDAEFAASVALYTDVLMALKKRIHEAVLTKLNLPQIASAQVQDEELRAKLQVALDATLRELRHELPQTIPIDLFRQNLLDELVGFGPMSPMLRDPSVDEIMVNGPNRIFVERKGRLYETGARFFDNRHLITIIQRIVEPLGRHVDEASPMVDARLPDGSRVNAIVPPLALDGPSITVRKFASKKTDDRRPDPLR